jgi:hypothetical protein
MRDPLGLAQPIEPDDRRGALVAIAQDMLRELCRADGIVELGTEAEVRGRGLQRLNIPTIST